MKNKTIMAVFVVLTVATLSACATYKTTMTNANGQAVTCEASGKSGIVTGIYLRQGFDACVADAKARGYTSNNVSIATPNQTPAHPLTTVHAAKLLKDSTSCLCVSFLRNIIRPALS